ncbi:MAG: helix-turn-helix domain-containing protein [Candidatus Zapsychrus exili]|nr:helix-turn-helix domain-containing protein [Candidatus Zapsychrus exili]
MISIAQDGKINVNWVQNGIRGKKVFRSIKEAERFQELVDDIQNSIKLAEEMGKFSRDFDYDPSLVNLKIEKVGKDIANLKESLRVKQTLQKKLGMATQKLSEQPRNVIDKDTFFKEIKSLRRDIEHLDRFFKEHAIVSLHVLMKGTLEEMEGYFKQQKETIKDTKNLFWQLEKDVLQKFSSITTKDRVLSIKEVAKHLGVSYSGVQTMMFMKKLPYFRVGNRYRIKENDLTKWIAHNKGS